MSRRIPNPQKRFPPIDTNPYQITSLPFSQNPNNYPYHPKRCQRKGGLPPLPQTAIDVGFSDATTTETYYDYCDQNDFHHSLLKESRNTFSDDSGSTRLPYLEFDEESNRLSRKSFSERSFDSVARHHYQNDRLAKDTTRRGYVPEEELWEERLYHEIPTPCDTGPRSNASPKRVPPSRLSDRPQSSMSSALTTAMIHGCGGKCQTFESICYFVLQLIFTMGILIGVSLCVAGLVLRKSAARNLQVLVYIGILLALVSTLLLTVQCRAKNTAKRRIKAIQNAKRAPIPMETLNIRPNPMQDYRLQGVLGTVRENQRTNQLPQIHTNTLRPVTQRSERLDHGIALEEQPGIPWWRRRDLRT